MSTGNVGNLRRNRKWFRLFGPRVRGTSDVDNGEVKADLMWVDDILWMSVESCRPPSVSVLTIRGQGSQTEDCAQLFSINQLNPFLFRGPLYIEMKEREKELFVALKGENKGGVQDKVRWVSK